MITAAGACRHTTHCKPVSLSHQTFERIQSALFILYITFLIDRDILASYIMKVLLLLLLLLFMCSLVAFLHSTTGFCLV